MLAYIRTYVRTYIHRHIHNLMYICTVHLIIPFLIDLLICTCYVPSGGQELKRREEKAWCPLCRSIWEQGGETASSMQVSAYVDCVYVPVNVYLRTYVHTYIHMYVCTYYVCMYIYYNTYVYTCFSVRSKIKGTSVCLYLVQWNLSITNL